MRSLWFLLLAAFLVGSTVSPVSAQQNARFGASALVGDGEVLVGEVANHLRPGTVYLYRPAGGVWDEVQQIRGPDAEVRDGFGSPLARTGNTLFVGQAGTFHVFERDAAGEYRIVGTLPEPDTDEGERFGVAAAAAGDWLLVGAPVTGGGPGGGGPGQAGAAAGSGAVYAFHRDPEGRWVERGKLTAADAEPEDAFGAELSVVGGMALIGAPAHDEGAGAAYLFRLDEGAQGWQEVARLQPSGLEPGDGFGASVALGDGFAVVGAPRYAGGHGAAYVFLHEAERDAWAQHARLLPFLGSPQDRFGSHVAVDGTDVWVGAPSVGLNTGSAYLFQAEGEGLAFSAGRHWSLDETTRSDRFGVRVTAAEGIALVAATGKDHGAGSVALYRRDGEGAWAAGAVLESEDQTLPMVAGEELECEDGWIGPFECSGEVSLLSYTPVTNLTLPGENRGARLSDLWGWHDAETGREYAIVGRIDGTAFVDVTDPLNPVLIGDLPQTPGGPPSPTWRDPKVYDNHAYIVADAAGAHGMQVFDLTQLRDVEDPPVRFEPTALYTRINSAHNVVVNEETGFLYIVGASGGGETCGGGLHMVDIREPANPQFVGCFAHEGTGRTGGGYTHDAQCVVYRGPDERYQGREICLAANERQLSIADVTDKSNPVALSIGEYPNPGYLHQGWLTEDHRYFFMDDEADLLAGSVETTRTTVFDLSDLEDPVLVKEFMGSFAASAHNLYIRDHLMYQANYRHGLHVIDISDPLNPVEVGHLDTAPHLSGPGFSGAWGNYPFFESGAVGVTSVHEGFFLVRYRGGAPVFDD